MDAKVAQAPPPVRRARLRLPQEYSLRWARRIAHAAMPGLICSSCLRAFACTLKIGLQARIHPYPMHIACEPRHRAAVDFCGIEPHEIVRRLSRRRCGSGTSNCLCRGLDRLQTACVKICIRSGWRPEPESNRRARICSPLRNHSAIGPPRTCSTVACQVNHLLSCPRADARVRIRTRGAVRSRARSRRARWHASCCTPLAADPAFGTIRLACRGLADKSRFD